MTEPVTISPLTLKDHAAWDDYVTDHADGSPFHMTAWRTAVINALGYDAPYLIARRGARIVGVLPLVHAKTRLFGNNLISAGFSVGGGILTDDPRALADLGSAAIALGAERGVASLELRGAKARFDGWATKAETYASYTMPLSPDADERLKAIPRKKRADVRKGIKADFPVDASASVDTFYELYARNLHALGTPVMPKKWYAALKDAFGDACEIATVQGPNGPVVGLLSFYHKDTVYPYYVGATAEARKLHAFDHVYWTLMERALERGCTVFDFGRSKIGTGAADYKKHWGFEGVPLEYQFHLYGDNAMPDINPNNPKYARFVKIWQKLPFAATKIVGPQLARQMA
jgi:FemAB-related protein (PEP-CTERM system-associated)